MQQPAPAAADSWRRCALGAAARSWSSRLAITPLFDPQPPATLAQVLGQLGDEEAIYSPLARGASVLSDRFLEAAGAGSGAGFGAADRYALHSSSPLAASAASSPSHQLRPVARTVQFDSGWSSAGGGAGQACVAAQRVGRRPSFSDCPARPASPRGRRVPRAGAEEIQPATEALWLRDSRDLDTGEAAAVRPAVRRMPRQQQGL